MYIFLTFEVLQNYEYLRIKATIGMTFKIYVYMGKYSSVE